jgi:ribosomal protein L13E
VPKVPKVRKVPKVPKVPKVRKVTVGRAFTARLAPPESAPDVSQAH